VHYGGNPEAEGQYVQAIIDTAFPFLEDLITRMTGGTVWLPALLKEWIFREIKVAQLVLRDLQSEHGSPKPYVIKTLQHHILWTYGAWPSPRDDLATLSVSAETDWEAYVERQKRNLRKTWDESLMVELPCPICDSETGDGSDVAAQVLLEDHPLEENRLVPEGFNCFVCGLHISPSERFLARHFVGAIPEDIAGAYLKDIGRA